MQHPEDDFSDFAMPKVIALMNDKVCRVFVPNPWYPSMVEVRDFSLYDDGTWRRISIITTQIEVAREDYRSRINEGHTPRNVIENPLNGEKYPKSRIFAIYFAIAADTFEELVTVYGPYPKKAA